MMLHLPDNAINHIAQRTKSKSFDENDYQKSCCVSMLTEWLKHSTDTTATEFIRVLECPAVALSLDVIDKVKSIIQCKSECIQKHVMVMALPVCKPDRIQIEFMRMLSDITKLLNDSNEELTDALDNLSYFINYNNTPMFDSSFLDNISSWKELIDRFIKKRLCTLFDVEWLTILTKEIVGCSRAVDRIKEYKDNTGNAFLTNKIPWERNPDYSENGIIQTKTNTSCQTVTFKDYDRSKIATATLLGINKSDLLPVSCTKSSLSYNWMISVKLISRLQFPNSITFFLKRMCEEAKIVQISISSTKQKATITINNLSIRKGKN